MLVWVGATIVRRMMKWMSGSGNVEEGVIGRVWS